MIRWKEVIQLKVISTLKNAMTSSHFAPTTFTQAVQGLISAYMTPYFKGEHKKDHKVQQEKMTAQIYWIF